jgi:hypothetical protein
MILATPEMGSEIVQSFLSGILFHSLVCISVKEISYIQNFM